MIRKPEDLTEPIRQAVDHRAVLFSHFLLAFVIAIHSILGPTANSLKIALGLLLSFLIILLGLLRVFDMASINSRPRFYVSVYEIIIVLGVSFLSNPASPYVMAFFIVLFMSNLYYGSKGVWLTVGCFGVMTVLKYTFLSHTMALTTADRLNIFMAFFIFTAICSLFINYQSVFDWDRTQLRETVKKEVIEQRRLMALINNMTESVLVLDKDGIIRVYNASALALINTNANLTDRSLDGLVKFEDDKGEPIAPKDLMPVGNKPLERNDVVIRYGEDDTAALSVVVTPIRPNFGYDDIEAGFVMTLRDITREKSLEEERDEFISVISHELRTPVTVVEAGVSNAVLLAEKMKGNAKLMESLKTAHDQSLFLANMLNDLSTFARAERGALEMTLEEIDPRELLDSLYETYHEQAEHKGLHLRTECDKSIQANMVSNRLYVREILQNFITNAIKYSDGGQITVTATPRSGGVLFGVSDQGIGISVSDQKKIFNKFYRAEDYRTRSTSGTGLGLYITRKLAKLLNASFEIESEVGKGSTFAIFVPDRRKELN